MFCSLLASAAFFAAGGVLLQIEADPKNAFLFGFSLMRLLLFAGTLIGAGVFLALAWRAQKRPITAAGLAAFRETRPGLFRLGLALLLAGLAWGWISLFAQSYLFGRWIYTFERLRPVSVALGAAAFLTLLALLLIRGQTGSLRAILRAEKRLLLTGAAFFALIIAAAIFILVTRLGLKPDAMFFNIPAMPISGVQFFPLLLFLTLAVFGLPALRRRFPRLGGWRLDLAIFALIYLAAVLAWNAAPPPRHPAMLSPVPPNTQPYPNSDARVHDSGAISILKGYGINFRGYTDKPLYMVFLSALHRLAGDDYWQILFLQVCVLALIPPVLYLLGAAFHSRVLGIFLALVTLLRQYNAIALSGVIDSSNARLLLTEVPVLLGLALFSLCAFHWLKAPQPRGRLALLAGGLIGAAALVRLNPLLLFPVVGLVALLQMRKSARAWLPQLALYTLGLAMLLVPWAVTGTNAEGRPWLILKFYDVFYIRYIEPSSFSPLHPTLALPASFGSPWAPAGGQAGVLRAAPALPETLAQAGQIAAYAEFILNHTLHNFVSTVIALPNSIMYEDLHHLAQREYWQPDNTWQGELPPGEAILLYLNLALVSGGLAYSWIHFRWAGLLPAAIFSGYSLALGFARNSGARYTVPVDWVIYLYYGLGLILALTLLRRLILGDAQPGTPPPLQTQPRLRLSEKWKNALAFALLIALGSVIPLAGRASAERSAPLPAETDPQAWQHAAAQTLPAETIDSSTYLVGEVYYPYYLRSDDIRFDLMTSSGLKTFLVDRPDLSGDLYQGQKVVVGYRTIDETEFVSYIFALEGSQARLLLPAKP